jgi:CDP-6-deoxy-D-xylo-4-hexulose-3-dehydrase
MHQIKKLDGFIRIRQENAAYWNERLGRYPDYFILHQQRPNTKHVWFAYQITIKPGAPFTKRELTSFLEQNLIETRPIEASDITEQPVIEMFDHKIIGSLTNSKIIHKNSFFIGNHQAIGKDEREYVADKIEEFVRRKI